MKIKKIIKEIKILFCLMGKRKKILLCNTPIHENIGDHAIAVAEKKYINKYMSDYKLIEIDESICATKVLPFLLKFITSADLIMLQGGGFMGDLWPRHESCMHRIINLCQKNKIIIFPQTCYLYDDSKEKIEEYKNSYKGKANIYFVAREKQTYNFVKNNIFREEKCWIYPDIVLSTDYRKNEQRDGILLCLREDKESVLSKEERVFVYEVLSLMKKDIRNTSTLNNTMIDPTKRDKVLLSKLDEFSKSELVITDRLHGMIFAAITGTPCITFNNLSFKVSGVYEWIEKMPYVILLEPKELSQRILEDVISSDTAMQPDIILNSEFNDFANAIRKIV